MYLGKCSESNVEGKKQKTGQQVQFDTILLYICNRWTHTSVFALVGNGWRHFFPLFGDILFLFWG